MAGVLAAGSLAFVGNPLTPAAPGLQARAGPANALGPAAVAGQTIAPKPAGHPDILVITADDMRADDLRWMPRTRHLLVHRGITFRNSFAPDPLCAPSRASFLTGRYPHNHRVLGVDRPYGFGGFDDSSTLGTRLRRAGYRTALVGKYVNGYGEAGTFRGHHPSVRYVPPGWNQWWGSVWRPGQWQEGGTYDYMHLTSNVNGRLRSWPGRYTTDVTGGQTRGLVRRFGRTAPKRPWFIWWTPVAPHAGLPVEGDDPGTIPSPDGVPQLWATPARPSWVQHRFDAVITHGAGTPPNRSAERDVSDKPHYIRAYPPLSAREKRAERDVTRQRAEALYVLDVQIGRTLTALRRSGQASRTIVVLTSDNGYYLGEHRKRLGKTTLHEPSIRVPLVVAGPGIPHGVRYDPATVEDLAVTVAGWAGTSLVRADGHSLRGTITHGDRGWMRPVVLEGLIPTSPYSTGTVDHAVMRGLDTSGIRTGRYAMIRYSTGETEVYDLSRDPLELHSLSGPASEALRRLLTRTWRQYADCAGAQCQVTLPAPLRTPASQNRWVTVRQSQATHRYFHY